ncbi:MULTISPECIES: hypothetical protein [Yersinia]|uniref:hypothetical protein n=1 Tax=Yersinia TaxID=629 RepID=UPI0005E3D1F3|nr:MULTISPECIES: hypothetical protein [Yersinia]RXA94346.1 hypothetical protein EQP49_19735 [Yersinia sp. 2105 StPb PI]CNI63645.1 Uncharacterised protein [Yersinia frederiksenii]
MRRIDIEGALPPRRESYFKEEPLTYIDNERQEQRFSGYLTSHLSPAPNMTDTLIRAEGEKPMQADYRLVSGPLYGTLVHVQLSGNGLHIVLSHTNRALIERLQPIQARWQRQLHQLGFPCVLEVAHARDIVG